MGPPPGGAPSVDPVLVVIGDMACTQTHVITPNGTYPLAGTSWIATHQVHETTGTPTYAIILTIVFFLFCLLGLLFLLIKEHTLQGHVQVSVQGPGIYHAAQVPVSSRAQIADIEQRVNYARSLVAALQR
jgi:hypothetical protein